MDSSTSQKFSYVPSLDNLRGYAVVMVMLFHGANRIFKGGWIGVDLFFVLSGYLITSLLLGEYDKYKDISLKKFYMRRFLRLLPALFTGVILANILWKPSGFVVHRLEATLAAIFYYTNIQLDLGGNMRHLWSLAVEEHFYLFWPITVLYFLFRKPHKKMIWITVGILAAVTIFRVYLKIYPLDYGMIFIDAYRFTLTRIDCILMGAIMAMILAQKRKDNIAITCNSNDTWQLLLLAGCFVFILFTLKESVVFWAHGGFILTNLLCTLTVLFAIKHPHHPALSGKIMHWIGARSYGIYVYHYPVFTFIKWSSATPSAKEIITVTLLRFLVSFVIAALSYKFIEKPILNLKKKFEVH